MDAWSKGRITLVGDAGYCPTLLTGYGSQLALVGAYVLAGELKAAGGDHQQAFRAYERELRPFVEQKQRNISLLRQVVPGSALGLWLRNRIMKLMNIPSVARDGDARRASCPNRTTRRLHSLVHRERLWSRRSGIIAALEGLAHRVSMIALGALLALLAAGEGGRGQDLFQIRFLAGGAVLAQKAPVEKGGRLVFSRHPDGLLLSVRRSEVAGVARVRIEPQSQLRPGEPIDVGRTGEGGARTQAKAVPLPPPPVWGYRSRSGRRLIVGYNVPFPPAPAVQRAPGEPPMAPESVPPPKPPDN